MRKFEAQPVATPLPIAYPSTIKEAIYAQEREANVEVPMDDPLYQAFYQSATKTLRKQNKSRRLAMIQSALVLSTAMYGNKN